VKLLHPIFARIAGPVRVIVVVKGRNETSYSSGALARSYLDAVCSEPVKSVMLCDSDLPEGSRSSLSHAAEKIAEGEADLVITTDLGRLAGWTDLVLKFLRHCALHNVRVIAFENEFDNIEPDWEDRFMQERLDDLLEP
jgi:hypothetical protein